MQNIKIGFIGIGNMGGALAAAVSRAVDNKNVFLADKNAEKAFDLAKKLGCVFADNKSVASSCDYIFLGVKPQMMSEMLEEIAPVLSSRTNKFTLITMAAGVKTERISSILGKEYPIIRIMPNTAVEVGEGMVLYTVNEYVGTEAENDFLSFMNMTGKLDKLPESLIDAGSAVSGCGPAFVYMFIEALADGGVKCGLPRASAVKYAEQTLIGAARLAMESGRHPEELKDAVCSPAGSTIEGCFELEKGGFRAAVIEAVSKSFYRTKELGK